MDFITCSHSRPVWDNCPHCNEAKEAARPQLEIEIPKWDREIEEGQVIENPTSIVFDMSGNDEQ